jgi:predicted transcriptional regulator YdeE
MARSGSADLEAFDRWWSAIADKDQSSLFPRDFMWFNKKTNSLEWLYALPAGVKDTGGYEVLDFPGGLYAVAACKDEESDIDRTNKIIHDWVKQSEFFEEDETDTRYDMGHIITPKNAKKIMGYHQMELFVPIVLRKREK